MEDSLLKKIRGNIIRDRLPIWLNICTFSHIRGTISSPNMTVTVLQIYSSFPGYPPPFFFISARTKSIGWCGIHSVQYTLYIWSVLQYKMNNNIFIWKNTKIKSYQRLQIKETLRRRKTVTSSLNIISTDQLGNTSSVPTPSTPESECLNIEGAQESIPRNQFRQPLWMWPGGPVRQPYSYLVPSPHRLFKYSSTALEF